MLATASVRRSFSAALAALALGLAWSAPACAQEAVPAAGTPAVEAAPLAECDAGWARRAEGADGARAKPERIDAAIEACKAAAKADPDAIEPRWKLMRALYFKGEYTTDDAERKKAIFDDGRKVSEETFAALRRVAARKSGRPMEKAGALELAPVLKGDRDAAAAFLWSAVDWGKWALVFGKSAAVKQGAAARIRDDATALVRMDPAFEDAGGHRVLGRLHHQTPSVPFFTGWASRSDALSNLKKAVEIAPKNFINRLYLAEAVWDYERGRRADARASVQALLSEPPSDEWRVEDLKTQEEARALLAKWTR